MIAELRAQLEVMRQYHDTLTDTVFWALGIVAAVTVALLTFASFFNLRVSEREAAAIREELLGLLSQRSAQSREEVNSLSQGVIREVETAAQRIKLEADETLQQFSSKSEEMIKTRVRERLAPIRENVAFLLMSHWESEAIRWEKSGVLPNAVRDWIEFIPHAKRALYDWRIPDALTKIEELLRAMTKIDAELIQEVSSLLSRLPAEHDVIKHRILAVLRGEKAG